MEHTDAETRVTEPKLDQAALDETALDETLARAIRLLISEAVSRDGGLCTTD